MVSVVEGAPIEKEGAVLSTVKVALGVDAGAVLPALSEAVPAAIVMPRVPSPVMPETATVRVVFPLPVTAIVPPAVPVAFRLILLAAKVTVSAPV
jgi:hypothetical protein